MSVAGVVVTYNRKELLLKNIKMLFEQKRALDTIIIIDNHGTDGTRQYLIDNQYLTNGQIQYIYLPENVGGAGGFEAGTKVAFEQGYDYVWLMDDDGRPLNEMCLENIVSYAEKVYPQNKKIMLNSFVIGSRTSMSFGLNGSYDPDVVRGFAENGIIYGKINPFNGTLISKELIQDIGFPNGLFFIKGDEEDYTIRAKKAGAQIATVVSSEYHHPVLQEFYVKVLFFRIKCKIESPWKEYYRVRNRTVIYLREKSYSKILRLFLSRIKDTLLSECPKRETLNMIIRGLNDGLHNRLGITVKP
jgi:GT2 family glycosyltransferase